MFDNKDKIIKVFYDNRDSLLRDAIKMAGLVNYDYVRVEESVDDCLEEVLRSRIVKTEDVLKWQQIKKYCQLVIRSSLFKWARKYNERVRKETKEKAKIYSKKFYHNNKEKVLVIRKARREFLKNSKVCNKCEVRKVNSDFSKSKEHAGGRRNICKSCSSKYHKNYTRDYGINKKYYLKQREWKIENKERNRKKNRTWERKRKSEMMNSYLRRLLTMQGIQKEGITPELLDIKKTILQIKRKIKQHGKDKNQKVNQQPS